MDLDILENPSQGEVAKYVRANKPVLIRGVVSQWPAYGRWTTEYITDIAGDRELPVKFLRNGDYAGAEQRMITIREYLDNLPDADSSIKPYFSEISIQRYLPELMDDLVIPEYFPEEQFRFAALYIGQHLFSQSHYHLHGSVLLCLINGSKRVHMAHPDQTRYLYKEPWHSPIANMSRTYSMTPDPKIFPQFEKAQWTEIEVKQGEMLFIPIWWWHGITNDELNIAVPLVWRQGLKARWLPPPRMRATYFLEVAKRILPLRS